MVSVNFPSPSPAKQLVGFVPESNDRGTFSLLSTCLFTTFLCTWVIIHPRVDDKRRVRIAHKFFLFLKTIVAPEFIAVEAAQEWSQARRTVQRCAKYSDQDFGMVQAFYVGMMGVHYQQAGSVRVLWPNQLEWLLEQGILHWKQISFALSTDALDDRSNADAMTKLFALCQVGWFVVQSVLRLIYALPLAPFESMTMAYIPLFAITIFFWWIKPKDITTSIEIQLPPMCQREENTLEALALSSKFDEQENSRRSLFSRIWSLTPRVFEKENRMLVDEETGCVVQERPWQVLQMMDHDETPPPCSSNVQTVWARWDPDLYYSKMWPVTCLFGVSFGALHLLSWNDEFPTTFELWLWRASSIASMVTMAVFMQFKQVVVDWKDPLMAIKIAMPLLYLLSRLAIMAVAFAALRASDPAVYTTPAVSKYWLHV